MPLVLKNTLLLGFYVATACQQRRDLKKMTNIETCQGKLDQPKRVSSQMDFDKLREFFNRTNFHHGISTLTLFNFLTLRGKTIRKVPQSILDVITTFLKMFPGAGYIARRIREAQDIQCWSFDEVDEIHREFGVTHGYRSENCSVLQAILSLFTRNNETMNFWTHFLPSIYFVWIFFSLATTMPLFTDEYFFPFVSYMITSIAYPLMSSLAHAFSCLSLTATHVCFLMDYATLSIYSWGAAILYYNYSSPQVMYGTFYATIFLPVAACLAMVATGMACTSRLIAPTSTYRKILRLGAFIIPYLWASAPLVWRLLDCDNVKDICHESSVYHTRQFIAVFLAAFFYASHIPERFAPGCFDFIGHSHNFLHVFGITATYYQFRAGLIDIVNRRDVMKQPLQWSSSTFWIIFMSSTIVIVNIAIIMYYKRKLKVNILHDARIHRKIK